MQRSEGMLTVEHYELIRRRVLIDAWLEQNTNACPHHEFKGFGTNVLFECEAPPLSIVNGKVKVPLPGLGLGVDIDPDYIKKHQRVEA